PSATLTIDSTKVNPSALAALEAILYGTVGDDPRLPLPAEVFSIFSGTPLTLATPTAPTYDDETGIITIPAVTGVVYYNVATGAALTAGALDPITVSTLIEARPATGYRFPPLVDTDWGYEPPED